MWVPLLFCFVLGVAALAAAFLASQEDNRWFWIGSVALLAFALLFAGIAGSNIESRVCETVDAAGMGLYSNTPYMIVGASTNVGDKFYSLVQILDGTGKTPIRCIQSDASLPSKFSVGQGNIIVPLQ